MSKHQHGTDDEAFCRAIGWQTPSTPLPDDYEEQLLERLFADGGPNLGDVSLHGLDELAPVSAGRAPTRPVSLRRERVALVREAVSPPPLVDTPPVSPKLSWHPSRRMTMVLAAAAAVALVGVQQLPTPPEPQAIAPVALPVFEMPAPDAVRPLLPETPQPPQTREAENKRLSSDDAGDVPVDAESDAKPGPDPDALTPEPPRDPGGRLAQRGNVTPRALAPRVQAKQDVPTGVASGVALARFDGSRDIEPFGRRGFGSETVLMSDGFPGLGRAGLGPAGLGPAGLRDFDPDAHHGAVSGGIVDDEMALPASVTSEDDVGPALLRAAPPPTQPVVANVAPHSIGPRWLGLGVSLPRDVQTSVPAGIQVVGAIDISKTHRQLQF